MSTGNDANRLAIGAVNNDDIGALASAIAQGADPNAVDQHSKEPLLHVATRKNNPLLVEVLLQSGADVNSKFKGGETALHRAAESNFHGVMIILLEHGALPDLPNDCGDSALHNAARTGNRDAAVTLLSRGANPNAANKHNGNLPLHTAASLNQFSVAVDLLKAGASIDAKNLQGHTALDLASLAKAEQIIRLLKERKSD